MHLPAAFKQSDRQVLKALVADYPLATLVVRGDVVRADVVRADVVPGDDGLLINHIPLLWNGNELHGHIARANPLAKELSHAAKGRQATAIFHGPNGYISPADYPSKAAHGKVVPTWNYAVVHVSGTLEVRDDSEFIRQQIDQLTATQETPLNPQSPWTLNDAPSDFAAALERSIVGIALSTTTISGKYKLSQNRPADDRTGAQRGVLARGNEPLSNLMQATLTQTPIAQKNSNEGS